MTTRIVGCHWQIDRLWRQIKQTTQFGFVRCTGKKGCMYKVSPWEHYSPYCIRVFWLNREYIVGITDSSDKVSRPSTSGCRLYVQGGDCKFVLDVLILVAALLQEGYYY